jgi:hypothetical protein
MGGIVGRGFSGGDNAGANPPEQFGERVAGGDSPREPEDLGRSTGDEKEREVCQQEKG